MLKFVPRQESKTRASKVSITGSKCHAYYTYMKKDVPSWDSKVQKVLVESFTGNVATWYGKQCEQPDITKGIQTSRYHGRHRYTDITKDVTKIGFVIHPTNPWLGYIAQMALRFKIQAVLFSSKRKALLGKISLLYSLPQKRNLPTSSMMENLRHA